MQLNEILADAESDALAILYDDSVFTYADMEKLSNQFANLFQELRYEPGDRVSILLGNDPRTVAAIFGSFKSGVIANPLHDRLTSKEVGYIIDHAGSKLIITGEDFADTVNAAVSDLPDPPQILCFGDAGGLTCVSEESLEQQSVTAPQNHNFSNDDGAVLLYTSGTTGRPKGVLLSRGNLSCSAAIAVDRYGIKSSDRTLCVMPISHTNGLMFSTIPFLMAGASLALRPRFSASSFWDDCRKYEVNSTSVSPAILMILLDTYSNETLDGINLDYVKVASAPTSVELAQRFEAQFGDGLLLETYGLTETTAGNVGNPVEGPRKHGSIGTVIPFNLVKIVDEKGAEVPHGESGEMYIGGPSLMLGYFRDSEATAAVIRDGYIMSGDIARMDEDGYVYIVGRKKELIIRGGENISPLEVDRVVALHPAVGEAVTVGFPDQVMGEAVGTCVVRSADVTESEIIEFCVTQMASFKVPQKIVFIDEVPRNLLGKILRGDIVKYFQSDNEEVRA
ncbi:MAG: class I adenylate-forming enzyme family protein [Gammaproteobacteria bacterium]|jgi:long-chain acyl-CoA synthetase|nr:class I adenylate-forming enzyme family protein [Gammaproteobacteria bacterium]